MTKDEKMEKRLRYFLESEKSQAAAFARFEKEFSKGDLEAALGGVKVEKEPESPPPPEGEAKRQAAKRKKD